MTQFEYLIPFVGFIYALSATDLLVSAHRIIIERKSIKMHAVPFIWAIVAFLMIINGWWGFLQINDKIELQNAGQLFLLSLLPLTLFLISSLSLPHKITQAMSLWDYFCAHKTPFYLCHTLYMVLIPLVLTGFADEINLGQTIRNMVFGGVFFALIFLKHWAWHAVVGFLFMIGLLSSIFHQSIAP